MPVPFLFFSLLQRQFDSSGYDARMVPQPRAKRTRARGSSLARPYKRSSGSCRPSGTRSSRTTETQPRRSRKKRTKYVGKCRFNVDIVIGASSRDGPMQWFAQVRCPLHSGHPEFNCQGMKKPLRILDKDALSRSAEVYEARGGSGVSRRVYYNSQGEVIDRQLLQRMRDVVNDAKIGAEGSDSPATKLMKFLRTEPGTRYVGDYYCT